MPAPRKLFVTTALPYANGKIHLGHLSGAYLPADIYVRFQRSMKRDIVFICGSDEHGVPITITAEQQKITPQQVVDKIISGQVKLYRFTVPEGLRVDEILPILASSELKLDLGKLKKLAATPTFVRKIGVPADGLEGFLLPDTYILIFNNMKLNVCIA